MSLLPFLLEYERPRQNRHLHNQNFGLGLTPEDYLTIMTCAPQSNLDYYRPWRNLQAAARDAGSTIKYDKEKFQVNLDVQHFAPEEINVKTVDGFLVVEAKHEEKEDDHGYISRSFVRKYRLPSGVDEGTVQSKLSSDGVLSITAPLKSAENGNERVVPIMQTGPVKKQLEENIDK